MSHAIGSDTQRPFAIVIIGGLVSSTLLTLLILPTLYEVVDRSFGSGRLARKARR
jgi:cobalt-zinc-cadmium resistance protein CzcA